MTAKRQRPAAPPPVVEASRVSGAAPAGLGEFTYMVLLDPKPVRNEGERRDAPRRRTRLRSGKVVDARGLFVTECLVHDLSDTGIRLRLPPDVSLSPFIHVYDDQSGVLHRAEVQWRKAGDAGVRFVALDDTPRSRAIAADMRQKFYKLQR